MATYDSRASSGVVIVVVSHQLLFLDECIESVLKQGLEASAIIVVDNGSPDGEVAKFALSKGVRTVRADPAVHPATARNLGVGAAPISKYIFSVDGDDVLLPSCIQSYLSRAIAESADVVYGPAELFGEESGTHFRLSPKDPGADLRVKNFVPANALFSRAAWQRVNGFDPGVGLYVDWDFWLGLASHGAKFAHVTEVHWRYRRHATSQLRTTPVTEKNESKKIIFAKHRRYLRGFLGWRVASRRIFGGYRRLSRSRHKESMGRGGV